MVRHKWSLDQDDRLLTQYRAGVPIDEICRSFSPCRGRSTIYRRLRLYEEPAREPKKKRPGYLMPVLLFPDVNPLIRELMLEAKKQQINQRDFATAIGVTRETLLGWRKGDRVPLMNHVEAAGRCLSLELQWRGLT